jgi:hypothetical protein
VAETAVIRIDCVAGVAAKKLLFPALVALIVQVPIFTGCTAPATIVQTVVVELE